MKSKQELKANRCCRLTFVEKNIHYKTSKPNNLIDYEGGGGRNCGEERKRPKEKQEEGVRRRRSERRKGREGELCMATGGVLRMQGRMMARFLEKHGGCGRQAGRSWYEEKRGRAAN